MLEMIWGARVPRADMLSAGYETDGKRLRANVNAGDIRRLFDAFLADQGDCLYSLFIEAPATLDEERRLQNLPDDCLPEQTHINVYYHDNLSREDVSAILDAFGGILTKDGLTSYGVISERQIEIGKYKYNVMAGYSESGDLTALINVMETCGITRTQKLRTAWDTFTDEAPGICEAYTSPIGKTALDVIAWLTDNGMYKAKTYAEPNRSATETAL